MPPAARLLAWVLALLALAGARPALAQIERPVSWKFASQPGAAPDEATLTFTATIGGNWHIYSQFIEAGGPEPTSFSFTPGPDYELLGKVSEAPAPVKTYEKSFKMNIAYFPGQAVFSQRIRLKGPQATVKGTLTFMACNDEKCLPPDDVPFSIEVKSAATPAGKATTPTPPVTAPVKPTAAAPAKPTTPVVAVAPGEPATPAKAIDTTRLAVATPPGPATPPADTGHQAAGRERAAATVATAAPAAAGGKSQPLWLTFLAGLLGGIAAVLMPCIFPLLPMTVSFFTKRAGSRAEGLRKALLYGASIVVIYVGLGLLITVVFGVDALNNLASNGVFNLAFFALLVVFATSFLGAFEITLPNSWVTAADTRADKGGLLGIFFMAATLALVSFSCTGPIVGTLLFQAASQGQYLGPAVGMLGFSLALAMPFTLFAAFPGWLSSLPKSGGWLNSVKVSLGFLELALALKFLSNVDLAYHWEWFDREIFLVLWIVIFALLGFYLLGKLQFSHDSPLPFVTLPRLFLAIGVFSFVAYLVPGLWGAPLRAVAAILPPQTTLDFDLYTPTLSAGRAAGPAASGSPHKYADILKAPLGLDAYFDYDEALAAAKAQHKPVFIDFTGHTCTNCRQMEASVWPSPAVLPLLRDKYVVLQLYVDDKTALPAAEQFTSTFSGKHIERLGSKWADLEVSRFNTNALPYYVLLAPDGRLLATPIGATFDPATFRAYLEKGL